MELVYTGNNKCEQFLYYKIDYYTQTGAEMMARLEEHFPSIYEKLSHNENLDANLTDCGYMNVLKNTTIDDFVTDTRSPTFARSVRLKKHIENNKKFSAFYSFVRCNWSN